MNRIALFIICFLLVFSIVQAQDRPLPLNIDHAYHQKTRSDDGFPGENYWQNSANYTIDAILDTQADQLSGKAEIVYFNNSPDTLHQLVFRLYQDFFRKGNARQWPANVNDLTDGMHITKLEIDGKSYHAADDFPKWYITNLNLKLKKNILPGTSSRIKVEWNFSIPTENGLRMRKYKDGHYLIAYWYPQIAVYDDVDGWDKIEYLGMVEFYNDFNMYDVHIQLPGDYVVWATGDLQNPKELYDPDIVKRWNRAKKSDDIIPIITPDDYKNNTATLKAKSHSWHFVAKQVPDFTFAASTHSNWDGSSLLVDSSSNRRVFTYAVYPQHSHQWKKAAYYTRESVKYLSTDLPGVAYPWSHMTSFWNETPGGGMESPMMANDGDPKSEVSFTRLIFHEITHSYFPFYMGTNERKYAWMDEGWAAYLPSEFSDALFPDDDYFARECGGYESFAGKEAELPLMVPSYQHNNYSSYRTAAYNRPAVAYHMLRNVLGDEMFGKALRAYMKRWNGKHPIPYDFFNTIENVSGRDLDWFWNPWFFENGYPDLAIESVSDDNQVVIKKVGNFPVPIKMTVTTDEKEPLIISKSINVWADGKQKIVIDLPPKSKIKKIVLGDAHIPDINRKNNRWTAQLK